MANYIISEIGGKQIWLEKNRYYSINKISASKGESLWIKRILLLGYNRKRLIGQPYLNLGKVLVEVVEHSYGPKLIIYKMKPKKKYHRKKGYRPQITRIKIKDIYI